MIDITHRSSVDISGLFKDHNQESGIFEFCFPAVYPSSKIIRDFVGIVFDSYGLTPPWRSRFILIIDELVNNSVAYGSLDTEMNIFRFSVVQAGENGYRITIEVSDTGNGPGTKTAREMQKIRDASLSKFQKNQSYLGKRGRGLFMLTQHLVDKLDFFDNPSGGLTVVIEKTILINHHDGDGYTSDSCRDESPDHIISETKDCSE